MPILQNYTRRAQLATVGANLVNFAPTQLTRRPIVLVKDGRYAALTSLPSNLTISGGAGTKYIYADLAAPSGTGWRGFLAKIFGPSTPNRADWGMLGYLLVPNDTSVTSSHASVVTLVMLTTAPSSESTEYRLPLGQCEWNGTAITSLLSYQGEINVTVSALIHGQCRVAIDGTDLRLSPFNGNNLVIDGTVRTVPSGGVALGAGGLTPGTVYFIYAAWSGSAIVLEASTTSHTTHTNGVETKSTDTTRTLVGMAYCDTGPAWADTNALRGVRSWFNDQGVSGRKVITADRTTTGTSFGLLNAEAVGYVLCWSGEKLQYALSGEASNGTAAATCLTGVGIDSTTTPEDGVSVLTSRTANDRYPVAVAGITVGQTEALHSLNILVAVSAGTGTWEGTAAPQRLLLSVRTAR